MSAATLWNTLAGFLPQDQMNQILRELPTDVTKERVRSVKQKTKAARRYVKALGRRSLGNAGLGSMGKSCNKYLARVENEPTFAEQVERHSRYRFALVELDRLIAVQKHVNSEFLETLKARAPSPGDMRGLLRFCLPLQQKATEFPYEQDFDDDRNTIAFATDHLDVRILGTVEGGSETSHRRWIGFLLGTGLHQMTVVHCEGRYLLRNGYHRAVALAANGHRVMPALVLEAESYEDSELEKVGTFSSRLIRGSAPPMLRDFRSPAAVQVPRRKCRMVITVRAESAWVPV